MIFGDNISRGIFNVSSGYWYQMIIAIIIWTCYANMLNIDRQLEFDVALFEVKW